MPELTRCETKRLYKVDGKKEWRWVEVAVADLSGESMLRCSHCHGAVKIVTGKSTATNEAQVAHRSRLDADNCQNGRGSRSSNPVE